MCAEHSNDLGQGHVPQFIGERSGDQPPGGVKDVVLHYKEPDDKHTHTPTRLQSRNF